MVRRFCRAAVSGGADLCRLGRTDRLRRRRGVSERRHRCRPGWRGADPASPLDHILAEGPEQERMEAWIVNEVNNGATLPGLYPMNAETKARYAATKK